LEDRRSTTLFPLLNRDELEATLKVTERAQNDAVAETPKTDDETMAGCQTEIITRIGQMRRQAVSNARQFLNALSGQRHNTDANSVRRELYDIPTDCEIEIARLDARHAAKIKFLHDNVTKQEKNYDLFRQRNKLHSIAMYPESQVLHWATIAALVILETLANAYFFQRGNELGYLGGIQQAFIFSLINVFGSIFVGANLFGFKNHIEFSKRLLGWSSLAIYGVVLVIFNLLIGHYRAALQRTVVEDLDPMLAFEMAYITFDQNIFGITDVEAWVLFCMGIVVGVFAFAKAYKADDPYPGYGDAQRPFFGLRDDLEKKEEAMRNDVINVVDAARTKLRKLPSDLKVEHIKYLGLIRDAESVPDRLNAYIHFQFAFAWVSRSIQNCRCIVGSGDFERRKYNNSTCVPPKSIIIDFPYREFTKFSNNNEELPE